MNDRLDGGQRFPERGVGHVHLHSRRRELDEITAFILDQRCQLPRQTQLGFIGDHDGHVQSQGNQSFGQEDVEDRIGRAESLPASADQRPHRFQKRRGVAVSNLRAFGHPGGAGGKQAIVHSVQRAVRRLGQRRLSENGTRRKRQV